jgi:hypothetical protein
MVMERKSTARMEFLYLASGICIGISILIATQSRSRQE